MAMTSSLVNEETDSIGKGTILVKLSFWPERAVELMKEMTGESATEFFTIKDFQEVLKEIRESLPSVNISLEVCMYFDCESAIDGLPVVTVGVQQVTGGTCDPYITQSVVKTVHTHWKGKIRTDAVTGSAKQ